MKNTKYPEKARIFLIDDHPVILLAPSMIIEPQPEMEVVGTSSDGHDLRALLHLKKPNLVILDLSMPDSDGLKIIRDIQRIDSEIKILVYSSHEERVFAPEVANLGANGFLTKNKPQQAVLLTIRSILMGNNVFPRRDSHGSAPSKDADILHKLSDREKDVLMNLIKGKKNIEISRQLFISQKTVATHKYNLMKKLNVHNIVELIGYAQVYGLDVT